MLKVTLGFVLSTTIVLLAVLVGYLTYSVPEELQNGVDNLLIKRIRHILRIKEFDGGEQKKHHRTDALGSFMLALGDQLLITGLALIIAAYAHTFDITIYSMNVAGALTFLSSAVHLSILPIPTAWLGAQEERQKNRSKISGIPKHIRFFAMIAVFLGMAFLFVLSEGSQWWPEAGASDLYFLCGIRHFGLSKDDLFGAISNYLILLTFVLGYIDAFISLYSKSHNQTLSEWAMQRLKTRWNIQGPVSPQRYIRYRASNCRKGKGALFLAESFAFYSCAGSFASWQIVMLIFALTYGCINIFMSRTLTEGSYGDRNTWGFGQIVPMVLLALPMLAAFEARNGKHNRAWLFAADSPKIMKLPYSQTRTFQALDWLESRIL